MLHQRRARPHLSVQARKRDVFDGGKPHVIAAPQGGCDSVAARMGTLAASLQEPT